MTIPRRGALALGLGSLIALTTACTDDQKDAAKGGDGSNSPNGAASSSKKKATDAAFSVTLPKGWVDRTRAAQKARPERAPQYAAYDPTNKTKPVPSITVYAIGGPKTLDEAERQIKQTVEKAGATAKVLSRGKLGGDEAVRVLVRPKKGDVATEQWWVLHGKKAYQIHLSASPKDDEKAIAERYKSILDSWKWA